MKTFINLSICTFLVSLMICLSLSHAFAITRNTWLPSEGTNINDKQALILKPAEYFKDYPDSKRASWTPQGRFGKRNVNFDELDNASILDSGFGVAHLEEDLLLSNKPGAGNMLAPKTNTDLARLQEVTKAILRRVRDFRNLVTTDIKSRDTKSSPENWAPGQGLLSRGGKRAAWVPQTRFGKKWTPQTRFGKRTPDLERGVVGEVPDDTVEQGVSDKLCVMLQQDLSPLYYPCGRNEDDTTSTDNET